MYPDLQPSNPWPLIEPDTDTESQSFTKPALDIDWESFHRRHLFQVEIDTFLTLFFLLKKIDQTETVSPPVIIFRPATLYKTTSYVVSR